MRFYVREAFSLLDISGRLLEERCCMRSRQGLSAVGRVFFYTLEENGTIRSYWREKARLRVDNDAIMHKYTKNHVHVVRQLNIVRQDK